MAAWSGAADSDSVFKKKKFFNVAKKYLILIQEYMYMRVTIET